MAKKNNYIYKDIEYDSKEEIEFKIFLEEAQSFNIIQDYIYQPPTYELIPKATYVDNKGKTRTLFRAHNYTADWLIYPTELFDKLNHGLKKNSDGTYLIDIKGMFNKNGGDRIFPIHQKLLYDKYKIIVNKVVPEVFFKQANIAPEGLRWNKNIKKEKTLKKSFIGLNSFEEFLAQSDNNLGKQINIGFLGK